TPAGPPLLKLIGTLLPTPVRFTKKPPRPFLVIEVIEPAPAIGPAKETVRFGLITLTVSAPAVSGGVMVPVRGGVAAALPVLAKTGTGSAKLIALPTLRPALSTSMRVPLAMLTAPRPSAPLVSEVVTVLPLRPRPPVTGLAVPLTPMTRPPEVPPTVRP